MLVHMCDECGKPSINRIAADDDLATVLEIFESSRELDEGTKSTLAQSRIVILETAQLLLVREQLLGRNAIGGSLTRCETSVPEKQMRVTPSSMAE